MYTTDGGQKTVYYAMTVTGIENSEIVEKPVRNDTSNSKAVTAKTSLLYEIPLVTSFPFEADGYLTEFENVANTFTRCKFRNERAEGDEAAGWTTESTDLNFTGYVVMDASEYVCGSGSR